MYRFDKSDQATTILTPGDRAVFKQFLGTSDRTATAVLTKLIHCGVVKAESPKSRVIEAGLPLWYANYLFPDLHRRFSAYD